MIEIIFVAHSQTTDNAEGIASGWNDPDLTPKGIADARAVGQLLAKKQIDAAFASNQVRAVHTARYALEGRNLAIKQDSRLRDVNFGNLTGRPRTEIRPIKAGFIKQPYPNGESYQDVLNRYQAFLNELRHSYAGQTVLLCASGVFPLEALINGRGLAEVLSDKVPTYRTFRLL